MKRTLGDSNEYTAVPSKKEKVKLDSQSSSGSLGDDVADGAIYDNDEYDDDENEDDYNDDGEEEIDEEDEEYEDDSKTNKKDIRPMCKYGASCYRSNPQHLADFQHPTATPTPTKKSATPKKSPAPKKTPKKTPMKKSYGGGVAQNQYTGPRIVPPEFLAKSTTLNVGWTMYALQKAVGNPNDTKTSSSGNTTTTTSADNNTTTNTNSPTKSDTNTTDAKDATSPNKNISPAKKGKSPKGKKGAKNNADNSDTTSSSTFQPLSDSEIQALFEPYPELKTKYDRSGSVLATKFMKMTAVNGLPLFQGNPSFNKELIHCINYIFWSAKKEQDSDKKKESIIYLADAYQSCQAVQATAILSTYSKLTNVDMTFLDQVRNLLDDFKSRNLDQLVLSIHPNANVVPDSNPQGQAPHIRSSYLLILDRNGVDLPGKQVALLDSAQPHPHHGEIQQVTTTWPSLFSVESFVAEFVTEINQGANAKFIDHSKFYQWVNTLDDSTAFDKHSVFYNEENKDDYDAPQKEEDQLVLPYLSKKVAVEVLCIIGIVTK